MECRIVETREDRARREAERNARNAERARQYAYENDINIGQFDKPFLNDVMGALDVLDAQDA